MKLDWEDKKTRDAIILVATLLAVMAFLVLAYIDFVNADYNLIENNVFYDADQYGVAVRTGSDNNIFINNTFNASGGNPFDGWAIRIQSSDNNLFIGTNITNSDIADVSLINTTGDAINNTFLDCYYETEEVCGNCELIREWYYRAYVNDTYANPIENVM